MFRTTIVAILLDITEKVTFTKDDFTVDNADLPGNISQLKIAYRYENKYRFVCEFPERGKDGITREVFNCFLRPGPYVSYYEERAESLTDLIGAFTNWLTFLSDELQSLGQLNIILARQNSLNDFLQATAELPNEYFSEAEGKELRARMTGLEDALKENLAKSISDTKERDDKIAQLQRDFERLRDEIFALTKRGWADFFLVKTKQWARAGINLDALKSGVQVVKGLLMTGTEPGDSETTQQRTEG
jgi:hypothetical protein